jgi:hypothetical protein
MFFENSPAYFYVVFVWEYCGYKTIYLVPSSYQSSAPRILEVDIVGR